jgi:hypothetical protein
MSKLVPAPVFQRLGWAPRMPIIQKACVAPASKGTRPPEPGGVPEADSSAPRLRKSSYVK